MQKTKAVLAMDNASDFGKSFATITFAILLAGCQSLSEVPTTPSPTTQTAKQSPDRLPDSSDNENDRLFSLRDTARTPFVFEDAQTDPTLETDPGKQPDSTLSAPAIAESSAGSHGHIKQTPPSSDLWQLTREHFGLNLDIEDPRIDAQIKLYTKHPRYLARVTARAERYYYYVIHQVIERGIPAEIALLPIIESAYDPFAYSHGRAAGPWQFIPGTAKHFGLKKSWWYDGRRDIQASTDAALTYLTQLNKRFDGDWQLALAGYNAGGGTVSKAMRKNRKANKATDFWSLRLPKETSAYVPKLIALAKIFSSPETYGVTLKPIPDRPYFTAVETHAQIDLAQAAELAQISVDELYLLNPGFNQWATDPNGPHQLLIPSEQADIFKTKLAQLPKNKRVSWNRYKVRSGDSLISIAKKNNTTIDSLRTANNLRGSLIRAGQVLLIPTASADPKAYALSSNQRQQKKSKRIALRSGRQKQNYTVQSGDSFWTISRRFGVSVRELASWNQMAPGDPLRIGKQLSIWQNTESKEKDGRNIVRKIGYRVRSGDSLSRIASRFNIKIKDIKRWNTLKSSKYLQPGQRLTLYVDVTKSR
ncbi:LysM peptidoglycan-binding domain-containing protein [Motiliproteus sp. MSK22-1]|uniref:LysM peptidoglycan-binding domain-containing protein n=1 Tax=Motiliproteus sp. MSK22-1 TaxID=1897630 RepID=UPI001E2F7CFD|nr:LysM peptidoglycan-binding domain-containing protein [Motiliproteus sp. MSK22-1]